MRVPCWRMGGVNDCVVKRVTLQGGDGSDSRGFLHHRIAKPAVAEPLAPSPVNA